MPTRDETKQARMRRRCGTWCDLTALTLAIVFTVSPANVPLWMLAAWPLIGLLRWLTAGTVWAPTPVDWPLGLLCLMGGVGWAVSALPEVTHDAFVYYASGIVALVATANWADSALRLRWASYGIILIALLLVALSPIAAQLPAPLSDILSDLDGINPNILGGALALLIPYAFAQFILPLPYRYDWARRLLALSCLTAATVALWTTSARGAYVGAAIGCAVVLFLIDRRWLWLIPVGAVAAGIAIWQVGFVPIRDYALSTGAVSSMEGRLEIWSRALYMMQDFAFTGIGLGSFNQVANILYPFFLVGPDAQIPHAHNLILQVGVDLGFPGLIAFLALCGLLVWMNIRVLGRDQRQNPRHKHLAEPKPVAIGLLGSYAALFTHGMVDAPLWNTKPAVLMWALLGLTIGVWRIYWKELVNETPCSRDSRVKECTT